ncbi:MAG TPA: hypothetical protein VFK13_05000 [Gemmatimonadaceae bacterium]|nr:hypothetical protein [Gemmatimonadaceae bacterium]
MRDVRPPDAEVHVRDSTRWILPVIVALGALLAFANAYTDSRQHHRTSWWWIVAGVIGIGWAVAYLFMTRPK